MSSAFNEPIPMMMAKHTTKCPNSALQVIGSNFSIAAAFLPTG
jgi:hypothetical protein